MRLSYEDVDSVMHLVCHTALTIIPFLAYRADIPMANSPSRFLPYVTQEVDFIFVTLALLAHRFRRRTSVMGFLETMFLYLELTVAILFYTASAAYAIRYGMAVLGVWCSLTLHANSRVYRLLSRVLRACDRVSSPSGESQSDSPRVVFVSPAELKALLCVPAKMDTSSASSYRRISFYLLAVSSPADPSVAVFSSISSQYGNSDRRFIAIDLEAYPEAAGFVDVDTGLLSLQIPSVLLINDGKVVRRLPVVDSETKSTTSVVINEANIVKFFEFN